MVGTKNMSCKRRIGGRAITESESIVTRLRIDSRGRLQIRQEDRDYLGLVGGELLEVTLKRVAHVQKKGENPRKS
jgi:hypothetical protein